MTEKEIQKYIFQSISIPNISYSEIEMLKIENRFIYDCIPLETIITLYKRELQVKEWNKSKKKNYYRVHMLNGGYKYVYMCEEMVKDFYGYYGYELVK